MSEPAILIATAKVRPGCEDAFATWKGRHDEVLAKFPGYLSSDIMPPDEHTDMWTILLNFKTHDDLTTWQTSKERADIVAELLPLVAGGNLGQAMQKEMPAEAQEGTNVTQIIVSKVKSGKADDYRKWAARMQLAQSKYPGYKGMYLQPPAEGESNWTTLMRFDTSEHLEGWLAAPERAALLKESKAFIEHEELMRLATSFPGWVPINPATGKGPPNWKTALLVLLGLYPIVMLEMRYLRLGLTPALGMFVGNVISVGLTSFVTMPLFVRWFGWWLFADETSPKGTEFKGNLLLTIIFVLEVVFFWAVFTKFFPEI
ncbi:MAG: antibiotic biosynthesis monooxygenase [Chthoniobacterales bacterium]